MAIVTIAAFQNWARNELGSADDTAIQAALDAAHYAAYDYCGRSFEVAGAASARSFVPLSWDVLVINDCTSITSVLNDGSTVAAGDYQAEPVGGRSVATATVPFTRLRLLTGRWAVDEGRASVTVTAAWGWAVAPPAAVEAVKVLAKDILQQRDTRNGVAGFGDFGSIRVRQNPYVAMLLDPLRRGDSWGIG
ncbi:hypothetical protein EBS40_07515 [bacterium]|nr:hypothetical protein [bacterium]NDG19204.1 hypothetical protein [Betaproteobacteria bacterium]